MELDEKAWLLLSALQQNGRASFKELAQTIGLSVPATLERVRRLEEAGVIRGFYADVSPEAVGYGVRAWVGIHAPQPGKQALLARLRHLPQVLECHHVAGQESYVMQVAARDLSDLEQFLSDINHYGETRTSVIFSTPIPRRGLRQPAQKPHGSPSSSSAS